MAELDNCMNCGKLYVRVTRPICQDCHKEEEKKFQIVYDFMKKRVNREATIPEIVDGTGVEEDLIIKFVKENRLRANQFPNLNYPCERCGNPITEGRLCQACSKDLTKDLEIEEEIAAVEQRNEEKERNMVRTYFAIDKTNKKN
ncbi:TIGR03826 family flagellar region protein [Amphibacillus sp. Q70]|uniref:TIGR03826 family flagellar region protein n=1 Tax=Amphibacillus sp. Q70 TaxID=3453416 RepID=UPI003F836C64